MNNEEIIRRFDSLESDRKGSVEQVWDMIERFVVPMRGDFYVSLDSENEVDWHRREVYDSTAVFAAQSLAANIHGNLTSPGQKWFDLRFRNDELNRMDAAKEWLEEASSRLYYALNEANFNTEISEGYIDLVAFGTTLITEEVDEDNRLVFSAVPVREIFFEQDHKKQVNRFYRRLQWTPLQIVTKFGYDNVPDHIKTLYDSPSASKNRKDVIFCIWKREDIPKDIDVMKPIAEKSRPYGYKYVLRASKESLGEEGGYYEMPAFVTRWNTVAGSMWGKSPANDMLGDILTLNQLVEATLEAAGKAIDPANVAEQNALLGNLDLDRGALNIVTDVDGVRPYESGSRFDVSNMEIQMYRESIRQGFFQDQLELKESPAMTATEVNVRWELMQRKLGATFTRLKTDLLDPLIQRSFNIMFRAGLLPPLPENIQGMDLDIEYTGPLPRAQQATDAMAIEQWLQSVAELSQIRPSAMDIPDWDSAIREIARLRGVPAKAVASEDDVDRKRQEDQQKQNAMMAIEAAQGAGQAMKAVGEGQQALTAIPGGAGG